MHKSVLLLLAVGCSLVAASITPYGGPVPSRILLSAPWTGFNDDGSVNLNVIPQQAEFARKNGVNYVWISGGMAQWGQLTTSERKDIATSWVEAGHKEGLYVIIHVGGLSIPDSIELAKHADKIGADAIAIIPAFVPSAPDVGVVVDMCAQIAASTKLPMFYYHIPGTTGYNYKMMDLLKLAVTRLPTLRGIKYVSSDFNDFHDCLHFNNGSYVMLWAPEPKLAAMPFGAKHMVLAEAYFGPYVAAMLDAYEEGDVDAALAAQLRRDDLANVMQGAEKDVMKMLGIDLGPPRLPSVPYPKARFDAVEVALRQWGFLNSTAV